MKLLGQKIAESRKNSGLTLEELGEKVGISRSTLSLIERDALKGGPDAETVVALAATLNDRSILISYLQNNPVYRSVIPQVFSDLNSIREEPAIILTRFIAEAEESIQSAKILGEIFSNLDPTRTPNYRATLVERLEQIVDVARCAEILFVKMVKAGVLTEEDRIEIHARQQQKCVDKGHHKPEAAA